MIDVTVDDFPKALRPIIEHGFLKREFGQGVRSRSCYRACATLDEIPIGIGGTVTKSRVGQKTDMAPETNENYTVTLWQYGSVADLNVAADRVGIAYKFLQNAYVNGEQAGESLDLLAARALHGATFIDGGFYASAMYTLRMYMLCGAVAELKLSGAPEIDGAYNCYLDDLSSRQLFADPDFKRLFEGAESANQVFRRGVVCEAMGLRFMPTAQSFPQRHPTLEGRSVRRVIVAGAGALIEGVSPDMIALDAGKISGLAQLVEGVVMVNRPPLDPRRQIIAQSWYWIGGFGVPIDVETGVCTRAVGVEHIG